MAKVGVEDLDVYEILKLPDNCTTQDIKKAYRKAALECHPDKNPDDAKAADKFIQLGAILKLLLEPHARNAYDALRKARLQNLIRLEKQDSVRKKFREDLERRERESASEKLDTRTTQEKLRAEVERLRKESSRQLEEELAAMQRLVEKDLRRQRDEREPETHRLKLKWKRGTRGYDSDTLTTIFSKYGQVSALVISKKGGSALLEYEYLNDPHNFVESERGREDNPIQVTWVSSRPRPTQQPSPPTFTTSNPVEDGGLDFEELVFQRLREAQKKQESSSST